MIKAITGAITNVLISAKDMKVTVREQDRYKFVKLMTDMIGSKVEEVGPNFYRFTYHSINDRKVFDAIKKLSGDYAKDPDIVNSK